VHVCSPGERRLYRIDLADTFTVYCGDALDVLKTLPCGSVNCCVTSPPYYGLRDYGVEGQLGLENTPDHYIENLVNVFREVRRVLPMLSRSGFGGLPLSWSNRSD
jgi:DNA modification methylase